MLGQLRVFPRNSKHRLRLRRVDITHVNEKTGAKSSVHYEISPPSEKILWINLPLKKEAGDNKTSRKATFILRHPGQIGPKNFLMEIHRFHDIMGNRHYREMEGILQALSKQADKARYQVAYDVGTSYCIGIGAIQGQSCAKPVDQDVVQDLGRAIVTETDVQSSITPLDHGSSRR